MVWERKRVGIIEVNKKEPNFPSTDNNGVEVKNWGIEEAI